MRVFDTVESRIERMGDGVGVLFPVEYEMLEGFDAELSAAVEGNELIFIVKPRVEPAAREAVDAIWRDLRVLFSKVADIGEKAPWGEIEVVWESPHVYEDKVPIAASEVIKHRYMAALYEKEEYPIDKEDVRKSIHDTMTKLCEVAALRLGFRDRLFAMAFGQAVGNHYSHGSCVYGMYDIVCEIFREEFVKINDDRFWDLTSPAAQDAVKAAYERIRHLSEHPEEYEKEKARIQAKWGFPLKAG